MRTRLNADNIDGEGPPVEHAIKDTRVNTGGLMRCCVGSLAEWCDEQGADARVADGTIVSCRYCDASMILDAGAWRWNR